MQTLLERLKTYFPNHQKKITIKALDFESFWRTTISKTIFLNPIIVNKRFLIVDNTLSFVPKLLTNLIKIWKSQHLNILCKVDNGITLVDFKTRNKNGLFYENI